MRILWIGKRPTDGHAGDEVFDRRTIAAVRARGAEIDLFHPEPVGRIGLAGNLARGLPYYRARFTAATNIRAIREKARGADATVCSWEPFDALVRSLSPAPVLILHNITSRALPALFPGQALVNLLARQARYWERTRYRQETTTAIAALSRRDLDYLAALPGKPRPILLPPGMPPCAPLDRKARVVPELVISGTYKWVPKRRDILAFAQAYHTLPDRLPIRADALPAEAVRLLQPAPLLADAALRFGLITDRFESGHKLKTLAYIAANQIVLSFADVAFDFAHIPDHNLFIRRVHHVRDLAGHIATLSAFPPETLRQRFLDFQSACAAAFTWDAVAETLLQAIAAPRYPASRISPQLVENAGTEKNPAPAL